MGGAVYETGGDLIATGMASYEFLLIILLYSNIIKIKKRCNMRTVGKVISWFFFIYFFVMLGTFLFLSYKENKRYQLYAIVSFIFKGNRVETHAGAHDIDPQFETYGSKCRTWWGIKTPGRLLFILT